MKRTSLLKKIKQAGCELVRHGARYYWYRNPEQVFNSLGRAIAGTATSSRIASCRSWVAASRGRLGKGYEKTCAHRPLAAFTARDWTRSTPAFEGGG